MSSFRTTVYVGTVGGKKRRKTVTAKSKRELQRKVMALKLEVARGKDCYTRATFDQWAEKWLEEVVRPKGLSAGTVQKYESGIRHLDGAFHGVRLRDIHLSDMQQLLNRLAACNPNTGKPSSKATLLNIKKVAAAIFRYARQNNIEGVPNFFDILEVPSSAPVRTRRALKSEEIDAVLETPHWAQPMAMVMLFCGLRLGECVPLRWEDVDFEKGVLRVWRSADLQSNTPTVKDGGKSAAARRIVPMPDVLVEYLLWYRDAREDGSFAGLCGKRAVAEELELEATASEPTASGVPVDPSAANVSSSRAYFALHPTPSYRRPPREPIHSNLLFTNLSGTMHSKSSLHRMWEDYMRELNAAQRAKLEALPAEAGVLPLRFTAHNLRHTYATMLYLQGVDIRDAMAYMGHATYQVTLGIYTDTEQYCRFDIAPALATRLRTDFLIPKPEI